ncbi:alpha/beta fold hydrolase [Roseateles sp. DAIF2]|uniref:alpha/beta hydrolase n=1 Tax=Roseateles sp. DAIF2 TaxID=2714952 RepID=UPI0018A2D39F|nr:alpha/beta hydrolase [Roseateles sp. DAIF2]QPF71569.1 alpha/beta fold hydrolase [Roseateles sp. DAIF2]
MSCRSSRRRKILRILGPLAALALLAGQAQAQAPGPATQACRVEGLPTELQCGLLKRPLDPSQPQGQQIEIHYLVLPAMARNKQPDPVLMLAGGPGQSAINIAALVLPRFARLNNRRDLVFIDQRGTGRSAPLDCPDESRLPLAEALDPAAQLKRLDDCRLALEKLPHGDLRFYTTEIAMQDIDAVRQRLGVARWNLVGGSYGTRAALDYQRQFPSAVRRLVIDGVAPPDMALPAAFSTDGQSALEAMFRACEGESACRQRFPALRADWDGLLASLPRQVEVLHALSGEPQRFTLTRSMLLRGTRLPLYNPALASALPAAIHQAARGRFQAISGLAGSMGGGGRAGKLAAGMHFSVICAEDLPRLAAAGDAPGRDFGRSDAEFYQAACKTWPRGAVSAEFYRVKPAAAPVMVLSGGADPVTPPRHGERVTQLLGPQAAHVVVPEAGHGVTGLPCMREVIHRFIDTREDAAALKGIAAGCATRIPRPGAYLPIEVTLP